MGKETSAIFAAPTLQDARKRMEALQEGLGRQVPEAMECLRQGFAAATCFFSFPKAH
ncbi:transposase [Comamonas sp. JC664]|nr:transposase [Comamonas sp. JC664]GHH05305.1 hypothetical protein GCM10012319_74520 [Comamonas sp. KCTC 72670]